MDIIEKFKQYMLDNGITYEEAAKRMRLQLFFDGKPDEETRDIVKKHGFRWSPKNGCWQRQLTTNGKYALKEVITELQKTSASGV